MRARSYTRRGLPVLAVALSWAFVGCGDSKGEETGDKQTPCEKAREEAAEFVATNKSCVEDYDCVKADAECAAGFQEACRVTYLSSAHDKVKWKALRLQLNEQCNGGGICGIACFGLQPEPWCVQGTCKPGALP